MTNKTNIKKILKYSLIGLFFFILLGAISNIFENWEYTPSYTPTSFTQKIALAEQEYDKFPFKDIGDILDEQTTHIGTSGYGRRSRGFFTRPTACMKGTLYKDNVSRNDIRCSKSFDTVIGTSRSLDEILTLIQSNGWNLTDASLKESEYQQRLHLLGKDTRYSFNNKDSITLEVTHSKKYEEYCDERIFCSQSELEQWDSFVTISIGSVYQTF